MASPRRASFFGPNAEVYSAQEYDALAARLAEAERLLQEAMEDADCEDCRRAIEAYFDNASARGEPYCITAQLTDGVADSGLADHPDHCLCDDCVTSPAEMERRISASEKRAADSGDALWPDASIKIECQMMNPPKPMGFVVFYDGKPRVGLTHKQVVAALAEWDAKKAAIAADSADEFHALLKIAGSDPEGDECCSRCHAWIDACICGEPR